MLRLQPVNDCSGAEASTALQSSCVLAPAVIPVGCPTNLAFAMWTPTTRQQHTPMTDAEACSRRVTPVRPAARAASHSKYQRQMQRKKCVNNTLLIARTWNLRPSAMPRGSVVIAPKASDKTYAVG
jgi:hypothetical protein